MLSFCQVHILSLPFSNRSVIVIDPYRSLYISFQPECLHVLLVHCSRHSKLCKLQGSHGVPCFSFLPVCFHIPFDPLSSCFIFFNLQRFSQCSLFLFDNGVFSISFISLVFSLFVRSISQGSWFHSFVKEAT